MLAVGAVLFIRTQLELEDRGAVEAVQEEEEEEVHQQQQLHDSITLGLIVLCTLPATLHITPWVP